MRTSWRRGPRRAQRPPGGAGAETDKAAISPVCGWGRGPGSCHRCAAARAPLFALWWPRRSSCLRPRPGAGWLQGYASGFLSGSWDDAAEFPAAGSSAWRSASSRGRPRSWAAGPVGRGSRRLPRCCWSPPGIRPGTAAFRGGLGAPVRAVAPDPGILGQSAPAVCSTAAGTGPADRALCGSVRGRDGLVRRAADPRLLEGAAKEGLPEKEVDPLPQALRRPREVFPAQGDPQADTSSPGRPGPPESAAADVLAFEQSDEPSPGPITMLAS